MSSSTTPINNENVWKFSKFRFQGAPGAPKEFLWRRGAERIA